MTYDQARLRIWCPNCYPLREVRQAAVVILAALNAKREDIDQATLLVVQ